MENFWTNLSESDESVNKQALTVTNMVFKLRDEEDYAKLDELISTYDPYLFNPIVTNALCTFTSFIGDASKARMELFDKLPHALKCFGWDNTRINRLISRHRNPSKQDRDIQSAAIKLAANL